MGSAAGGAGVTGSHIALALALLLVALTWWQAARIDRLNKPAQLKRVAAVGSSPVDHGGGTEGGTMDHKASVASLLGSAAGAADALTECGLDSDDTELVANFITAMDNAHAMFAQAVNDHRQQLLDADTPVDHLNDTHTTLRKSLEHSPACTSMHFMWRLACILKRSASPDVVTAAREVVQAFAHLDTATPERKAVAKLAAVLPKE